MIYYVRPGFTVATVEPGKSISKRAAMIIQQLAQRLAQFLASEITQIQFVRLFPSLKKMNGHSSYKGAEAPTIPAPLNIALFVILTSTGYFHSINFAQLL